MARGPAPPPRVAAEGGLFAAVPAAAVAAACSWTRRVSRGCPMTTDATPAPSPARKSLVAGENEKRAREAGEEVEVNDASSLISPSPPRASSSGFSI